MQLRNKKTGEIYYMYSESVDLGGKPRLYYSPEGKFSLLKRHITMTPSLSLMRIGRIITKRLKLFMNNTYCE